MNNMWIIIKYDTGAILDQAGKFKTQDDAFTWMWKHNNTGQWITLREDRYQSFLKTREEV